MVGESTKRFSIAEGARFLRVVLHSHRPSSPHFVGLTGRFFLSACSNSLPYTPTNPTRIDINMMEESLAPQERTNSESSSHIVHAMMQFAMAIKHRKNVVILCVFVTLALGALYYSTATRLYSAQAELLIFASGEDVRSTGISGQGRDGKNLMQTFERLITRSNVIEAAIERLTARERVDLEGIPPSKWVAAIQSNLSAKTVFGTNNIEIEYLSRDPAAAVAVVNQVVEAYREYLDNYHKQTSEELIRGLKEQQAEVAERTKDLNLTLSQMKAECGDFLSTDPDSKAKHPVFERLADNFEQETACRTERLQMQAKLDNLRIAVAQNGDLQPHIMAIEDSVGQDVLKSVLGVSAQDNTKFAQSAAQLTENRAKLESALKHYGENHPEIEELRAEIRYAENELKNRYQSTQQRMNARERPELARVLIGFLSQHIDGLLRMEQKLAEDSQSLHAEVAAINEALANIQGIEGEIEWANGVKDQILTRLVSFQSAEDRADHAG